MPTVAEFASETGEIPRGSGVDGLPLVDACPIGKAFSGVIECKTATLTFMEQTDF